MEGTFQLLYQGVNGTGEHVWSAPAYNDGTQYYWCMTLNFTNNAWAIVLDDSADGDSNPFGFWQQALQDPNGCIGPCNPWEPTNGGDEWVTSTPEPDCPTTNTCGGCSPELQNEYTITVSGLTDWPDGNGVWTLVEGAYIPFVGGSACTWVNQGYINGPMGGTGNWAMYYNGTQGRWELGSEGILGFYLVGTYCDGPVGVWTDAETLEFSNNPASCVVS